MQWLEDHFLFIVAGAALVFAVFFIRMIRADSGHGYDDDEVYHEAPEIDIDPEEALAQSDSPLKHMKLETGEGVAFNFSGHAWDAFEALGVKPDASFAEIELAYKQVLNSVEPQSREFIELAFVAITEHFEKRAR